MHECVYADKFLQSILEETSRKERQVKSVKVEVGELLGLTGESLTMAYGILSKETRAEGSILKVTPTRGSVTCPKCGFSGRLQVRRHNHAIDPAFTCPRWGSSPTVKEGLNVKITGID